MLRKWLQDSGGQKKHTDDANQSKERRSDGTRDCEPALDHDPKRPRTAEHETSSGTDVEDSTRKSERQPDIGSFNVPVQKAGSRTLRFQAHWIQKYPWIDPTPQGVLCKICVEVFNDEKNRLNMNWDKAFVSQGYTNWKHALENFQRHTGSKSHMFAVSHKRQISTSETIEAQLNSQALAEQEKSRQCYLKVIAALQLCARQGLAIRGHDDKEGNFWQMLKLLAAHDPELNMWLEKRNNLCSPQIQNEVLNIMSSTIVHGIVQDAVASGCYAIMVDGTQDISGVDQHSVCIRFVDEDLRPREEFLGLYALTSTTGEAVANMVKDDLCRLQLPLCLLRGQTYDGATNMSGQYNGAQAVIKREQPLAIFVHCTAHASNLASTSVAGSSPLVCSAMEAVNELGVLLNKSGKFKATLQNISAGRDAPTTAIKPLCPTRFLARVAPVEATLKRYDEVLLALDDLKGCNPVAYGLLDRLKQGNIVLGMFMADTVFPHLENLNRSLQGRRQTLSGARDAVKRVMEELADMRSDATFDRLFEEVTSFIEEKDLDPVVLPRKRRPPKRLSGDADPFHHQNAKDHYKVQFFEMIDTAIGQLNSRFFQEGMGTYTRLEELLLNKCDDLTALEAYTEIDLRLFKVQLPMFHSQRSCSTMADVVDALQEMSPEVRKLFNEVERLARLLLTIPVSSCENERSFSALRRLKTYLRNTIGQQRLNSLAVCHVHKHLLDHLPKGDIIKRFVEGNDTRMRVFGKV